MEKKIFENTRNDVLDAWNKADPEGVASFYTDDLEYRDPTVPEGIFNKADFIKYLKLVFRVWPRQKWVLDTIMPHDKEDCYSVSYQFMFGNDRLEITGYGMDRVEHRDDGKIRLNYVYLNAEKWKEWIKRELEAN